MDGKADEKNIIRKVWKNVRIRNFLDASSIDRSYISYLCVLVFDFLLVVYGGLDVVLGVRERGIPNSIHEGFWGLASLYILSDASASVLFL